MLAATTSYTFSGVDKKTGIKVWHPMIQVEASPTRRYSTRKKPHSNTFKSNSTTVMTRSRSNPSSKKPRYRVDFDIDSDEETGSDATRDYDKPLQRKPKSKSSRRDRSGTNTKPSESKQKTKTKTTNNTDAHSSYSTRSSKTSHNKRTNDTETMGDEENEITFPSIVDSSASSSSAKSFRSRHEVLSVDDDEVDKELADLMRDIQENENGKLSTLPSIDDLTPLPSRRRLRRYREQEQEEEQNQLRSSSTANNRQNVKRMCTRDPIVIEDDMNEVDSDSSFVRSESSPSENENDSNKQTNNNSKRSSSTRETTNQSPIEIDYQEDSNSHSPPSSQSSNQSPTPPQVSSEITKNAHSLLSLSNQKPFSLQRSVSTSSVTDSEPSSSFQSRVGETTITITSSSNPRPHSSFRSHSSSSSYYSNSQSQSHSHFHAHPYGRNSNGSHGSNNGSTPPLLPPAKLNHLSCEHMSLPPLNKIIQMSTSDRHATAHQQLDYGSTLWQTHRDFFSKQMSARARAMLPSLVSDIVWPEAYGDFSNVIKRRYLRSAEPSKRVSYDFSKVSHFDGNSVFSQKAFQLEARQTATERELQKKIEKAMISNLQSRQTQRSFLLTGEPGCGKTSMVDQVVLRMNFPRLSLTADTIMSKFVGETGKQLKAMFEVLKVLQPVALVIDECESILRSRSDGSGDDYRRDLLTQLLPLLGDNTDGICGLILVYMTNLPESLDPAVISRLKGNTLAVELTDEVRSTVWYNQLYRNTFTGIDDSAIITRLLAIPIMDLRVISDICAKCYMDIRSEDYSMVASRENLIDVSNDKCIIWQRAKEYIEEEKSRREKADVEELQSDGSNDVEKSSQHIITLLISTLSKILHKHNSS